MNERIKELYKEAYRQDCLENNPNWKEGVGFDRFTKMMEGTSQKFAELIVKECAEWLKQPVNQTPSSREAMNIAADRLKEHFGVE